MRLLTFFFKFYKSVLGPKLNGIACSSVRKHRNSPQTHVNVTHTKFNNHHDIVVGKDPL